MKKNRILIISIVLAIAFVACPIESTRNITAGIGFILGAVSVAWLGVRQRKGAQKEYEDTVRRYTGTTMMKVVWIEESVNERWEQRVLQKNRILAAILLFYLSMQAFLSQIVRVFGCISAFSILRNVFSKRA